MKYNNEKVLNLLIEKGEIVKKGRELQVKIEEAEKTLKEKSEEQNKLADQANTKSEKIMKIIKKEVISTLGEFETVRKIEIVDGAIELEVIDLVEELKSKIDKFK